MNPLAKAWIGSVVRAALVYAGAHGVNFGDANVDQIVDALLIIGPVIWSLIHKVKVQNTIADAKEGLLP